MSVSSIIAACGTPLSTVESRVMTAAQSGTDPLKYGYQQGAHGSIDDNSYRDTTIFEIGYVSDENTFFFSLAAVSDPGRDYISRVIVDGPFWDNEIFLEPDANYVWFGGLFRAQWAWTRDDSQFQAGQQYTLSFYE